MTTDFPQLNTPGEHEFIISGPAGDLQIVVNIPEKKITHAPIAIICHPHPLFAGTMDNKVVTRLSRTFRDLNMISIRFNFRGVGKSTGEFATGMGETDDLFAVMTFAKNNLGAQKFILAGFSFGAYVAYRGCALYQNPTDIIYLISVAPAVTHFDFKHLPPIHCPWLIVQGEADEVVDPQAVFEFLKDSPQPHQLIRLPGVGHFFHGQLVRLQQEITSVITPYIL